MVLAAKSSGQDIKALLERIRADEEGKGENRSYYRRYFAGLLLYSPPTLKQLSEEPPPPDFQHVEGDHQ